MPRFTAPSYLSRRVIERAAVDFLRSFPLDTTVVDIGCGVQPYRAAAGCRYVGVDADPMSGADIISDSTAIPLASASAAGILCTQTLQHTRDVAGTLREMHRLLVPGGRALITAPFLVKLVAPPREAQSERERAASLPVWRDDFWRFTPYGLVELCADFEITSITPTTGYVGTITELINYGIASLTTAVPVRPLFALTNCVGLLSDHAVHALARTTSARVFNKFYTTVYQSVAANYVVLLRKPDRR